MATKAVRSVCFTLFSDSVPEFPDYVRYAIYQREKSPTTGALHYQGYMEFTKPVKFGGLKKWSPTAHFEERKGTRDQARDYCRKEESRVEAPVEFGEFGAGQGRRTDLAAACELVKESGAKRVAEEMPEVFVKFHKGLKELERALVEKPSDSAFAPRPWQKRVLARLEQPPNDRTIIWVSDTVGNRGKSRLARYLCLERGAVQLSGKVADMAYAYSSEPIVIFDIPRTEAENVNHLYSFAEKLKNGYLFSSKYESVPKYFQPPHVLFFANFPPPSDTWSSDRLVHLDLACPDHHV